MNKELKPILVRDIPQDVHTKLKELAKKDERSLNSYVKKLLIEHARDVK